eukprot:jgi/Mesvir1/22047/Mv12702-RA.1
MMHTWFRPSDDFLIGGVVNGVRAYDPWHRPSDLDMIKSEEVDVADSDDDAPKSVVAGMTAPPSRKTTEEDRIRAEIEDRLKAEYDQRILKEEDDYRRKLGEALATWQTKTDEEIAKERNMMEKRHEEEKARLAREYDQQLDKLMNERDLAKSEADRTTEELVKLREVNNKLIQRVKADWNAESAEIARLAETLSTLSIEKESLEARIRQLTANGDKVKSRAMSENEALRKRLEEVNSQLDSERINSENLRKELKETVGKASPKEVVKRHTRQDRTKTQCPKRSSVKPQRTQ